MNTPTNWRQQLTDLGGYENEMLGVPAGGVRKMVDEIEQLRAKLAALEIPPPPHECQTEGEKKAFAFGWWKAMEAKNAELAALEGQQGEPVAWWIPKAEQFCLSSKDGSRPFAKAWEPLFPAAGAREPALMEAYRAIQNCLLAVPNGKF